VRSQIAIQRLEDKFGFTNLINLSGGMYAWKKSINNNDI
jgi:rhodanese-related sulfurtransferase